MYRAFLICILLPLLVGCGAPVAVQVAPTPTPLLPAPALERPTYVVERGTVTRTLEITGRVTPVDLERLSFRSSGRVAQVYVQRGDAVQAGDVLAELLQDEALEALAQSEARVAQAERALAQAQLRAEREVRQAELDLRDAGRSLEDARTDQAARVREAELDLQRAEADLAKLIGDGPESLIRAAQRDLAQTEAEANQRSNDASEAKTRAENALIEAGEALVAAQQRYSDAFWDLDWVQKYGTHPREKIVVDPATGAERHRELSDSEIIAFERAYTEAERNLRAAERAIPLAERAVELARSDEERINREAAQDVADAREALVLLQAGNGDATLAAAQRRVEDARLALEAVQRGDTAREESSLARSNLSLEAARLAGLENELAALDDARLDLERAQRRVDEGRVIAPRAGTIVALGIGVGDTVEPYEPVAELADPSELELAAELSAEQMRELAEGMPAEARLVARPDQVLPAAIRRMPAPYGSGGSGAVAEQDRTTRFSVEAAGLEPGAIARISLELERKNDVLWLPPEAIRTFEGRRFVIVRDGDLERRVPVRVGMSSETRVEIVEGLNAGDLVVGQ